MFTWTLGPRSLDDILRDLDIEHANLIGTRGAIRRQRMAYIRGLWREMARDYIEEYLRRWGLATLTRGDT